MAYNTMQAIFEGLEPHSLSGVTVTDEELGTGSYATVLKLDHLGLKCAGKKIHKVLLGEETNSLTYTVRRFKDECQILSRVRHPNIIQFLGVFFQQGDHIPILVMEYLPFNLDQCLDKHHLLDEMQYSILHDVALGLHYLHSQRSPIVHRDLSSNNVLLTSNIRAKISDLGVARILNLSPQKVTHLTNTPGTPAFMPPEVMVAEPKYDTSVDIFSYGILMIHTLSGKMPVPQIESVRTEGNHLIPVSEAERREPFLEAIGKDHPLMNLILKCIYNNPQMRANTSDIVNQLADMVELHPISFTNQLDMIEYIRQLEERNETLGREKWEYKNSQTMEKAKQTREIISKLEKMQEKDQTEVQTLLHTMETVIDNLKVSLTDEVKKVLNIRDESTTHDLDELRGELKQTETASPRSPAPRQRRTYENTLPAYREKPGNAKSKQVWVVSGTLPASVKHGKAEKQEAVIQVNEQQMIHPPQEGLKSQQPDRNVNIDGKNASKCQNNGKKLSPTAISETKLSESAMQSHLEPHQKRIHTRSSSTGTAEERADIKSQSSQRRPKSVSVDSPTDAKFGLQYTQQPQRSKTGESKASQQPVIEEERIRVKQVGAEKNIAKQMTTESESIAGADARLIGAVEHPSIGGSKQPPPVHKKTQFGQGPPPTLPKNHERSITTSTSELESSIKGETKPRGFTVSAIIENKEEDSPKDKGRRRLTSDTTAIKVDPKKDTHPNKKKAPWLRNPFSKHKDDKSKPVLVSAHAITELSELGEFESSASEYDVSPQDKSSHKKATVEPILFKDDMVYPIYTAMFDYEATSPSELSFRKGDQMHIKSKGSRKTWHASLNGKEGNIPKSYVTALDDEEWFFGKIDPSTAKKFVMTSSNERGSFLVRQNKERGTFSVTIRDHDNPRHYHIYKQEDGMLYVSQQCSFRSISDLVQHHSQNADGLITTLAKPCIVPHCISDQAEIVCKEKLATGQFFEVWKGEWKGETVVINRITPSSVPSLDLLDKCAFLKTVNHENLVQFYAMYMNSEPYLVITEHMANGSLNEYLPSRSKDLKMAELIKISEQVAAAMQYLEERICIHQDLSAKNVMIEVKDEEILSIMCKLSIYPYVHKVSEYGAFYNLPARTIPIRWSSHEAILRNQINIKSNVWSFGIFMWEIVHYCKSYPYPEISEAEVLDKLQQGYRMPRPLGCPEEFYELLCDCWKDDGNSRPTFETLHWQLRDFYHSDSFGYQQIDNK